LAQHEKNLRSFLSILDRMQWAKKAYHATVLLTTEGRERERMVVIFTKEYLDKYLVVCHSVGLTRHIVENGGKLPQELG
jgi:hypothetical protein